MKRTLRHFGLRDLPKRIVRLRLKNISKIEEVVIAECDNRSFDLFETLLGPLTSVSETLHSGSKHVALLWKFSAPLSSAPDVDRFTAA
ncbi:hypothetical protein ACFQ15_15010 [Sphingomonas hankookensis]|uniref:hypothetical protein n=1 Tax=Sphingomonas hankookensis TaxID=563996 RepID=UPI001F57A187|nr:hypothetical protein [Sphingomonas hankookensis]